MSLPTIPGAASLYPHNMNDCSASGSNDKQNSSSEEGLSSTEEERKWLDRLKELKRYHIQHKNCNNSRSYGKVLKVWVDKQRRDYGLFIKGRASSMTVERMQKLESVGFEWYEHDNPVRMIWDIAGNNRRWMERFQELQSYKAKHGHCNVHTTSGILGRWVNRQRLQRSQMTDDRVQKLELIGFQWFLRGATDWCQELQSYKAKHGHCNVPTKSGKLGRWVKRQRLQYRLLKEGKPSSMTDERVRKLELIGIEWSVIGPKWGIKFQELQSYKAKHGHCNVPTTTFKLGRWVDSQRQQYRLLKEGKSALMTDERVQKLESIGGLVGDLGTSLL